jgi:hypothetical protein
MSEHAEREAIPRARLNKPPSVRSRLLEDLCTRDEMAEALNITWRTMYNYLKQGLPSIKVGQTRYYSVQRVREWMLSREVDRSPRRPGRPKKT